MSNVSTELAARLEAEADEAAARRRALLCAAVALRTTATIPAARRELAAADYLPPRVTAAAIAILDSPDRTTRDEPV